MGLSAIFLLPTLLLGQDAAPPIPHEFVIRTMQTDDGVVLRLVVDPDQAAQVPEWDPEGGYPPPLSMQMAIDLARDSVRNRYPQFDRFDVTKIEMSRFGWVHDDRWYYVISFRPMLEGQMARFLGAFALVSMDGTVVEPEKVVSTDKK